MDASHRQAFTLIELLVVISIIAVLSSMLMGAIRLVRESAFDVKCRHNERMIGLAMIGYANDQDDCLPPVKADYAYGTTNWTSLISPYAEADSDGNHDGELGWGEVRTGSVFKGCPKYKPAAWDPQLGYGMNVFLLDGADAGYCNSPRSDGSPYYGGSGVKDFRLSKLSYPSSRLIVADMMNEFRVWGGGSCVYRHRANRCTSALMCDMHVQPLELADASLACSNPKLFSK